MSVKFRFNTAGQRSQSCDRCSVLTAGVSNPPTAAAVPTAAVPGTDNSTPDGHYRLSISRQFVCWTVDVSGERCMYGKLVGQG